MNVGARIKQLRVAKKLTQRQLGDATNISQSVIARLEKGGRGADVESIESICTALGISLADFFDVSRDVAALPPNIYEFVTHPGNQDLIRAVQEMKDSGYNKEGIISWLAGLQDMVAGLAQKGLLAGQVYFDPAIKESTDKLRADFVEKRDKIKRASVD